MCAAQEGYYISPLYAFFQNVIGNNSNILNHKCPYLPGEYYFKDINVQAKHLPMIPSQGQYLINITVYAQSDVWLFNTSVYFSVTNYGTKAQGHG